MDAAKHMDMIVGVDVHIVNIPTPAGPVPTPIPHPHVGMVLDPVDFLPWIGGTTKINGLYRGVAGTAGLSMPHIGLGGPFVRNGSFVMMAESEIFMGSKTVLTDGAPQARNGVKMLSCSDIGIPPPPRPGKSPKPCMVLPTSVLITLPAGPKVMVGGPLTVNWMALGGRVAMMGLGAALRKVWGRLQGTRGMKALSNFLHGRAKRVMQRLGIKEGDALANRVHAKICCWTGEPVDVASGKVLSEEIDLELPGPIPFRFHRAWTSSTTVEGPLGYGWSHNYDIGLLLEDDIALLRMEDGRYAPFPQLAVGESYTQRNERLTLMRDAQGYAVRSASGLITRFAEVGRRDGFQMVCTIENQAGHRIDFGYDEEGVLRKMIDSAGRTLGFGRDAAGRVTDITVPKPNGPSSNSSPLADENSPNAQEAAAAMGPERTTTHVTVVSYHYDEAGDLTAVRDALGHVSHYGYQDHLLVHRTDRNGLSFYFDYERKDGVARCVHTWGDGDVYNHRLSFDDDLGITTVVDSLGAETRYVHKNGLVTETIDARGGTTKTRYNEHDEVVETVDAVGQRTQRSYDERGNCIEVSKPGGASFQIGYDEHDRPIEATHAAGASWQWCYDERGQLRSRTDPTGAVTEFAYEGGNLVTVTNAAGEVTHLGYDGDKNLTEITGPGGAVTRLTYDALGRAVRLTDAAGHVHHRSFDLRGDVVRSERPDGQVSEITYDGEQNPTKLSEFVQKQDEFGRFLPVKVREVELDYFGMGCLSERREAGTRVRFHYDTEEQLVAVENQHEAVYRFELDPVGAVVSEVAYDGRAHRYERDLAGRLTRSIKPSGRHTCFQYNALGLPDTLSCSDGTRQRYSYRPDGELLEVVLEKSPRAPGVNAGSATRGGGSAGSGHTVGVAFERDALGRVLKETQFRVARGHGSAEDADDAHTVESTYDELGRRVKLTSSLGAEVHYTYNAQGDLVELKSGELAAAPDDKDNSGKEETKPNTASFQAEFERDALGQELQRVLPGGVRSRWKRDEMGRPVEHEVFVRSEGDFGRQVTEKHRSVRYQWGPRDQLAAWVEAARGTTTFHYDNLGQLAWTQFPDRSEQFRLPDAVGNLFKTREQNERRYSPTGQLLTSHEPNGNYLDCRYDEDGNLVEKREQPRGAGKLKVWRYTWDGLGHLVRVIRPDGDEVTFEYDGLGRRVSKTFRGRTTRWVWDGDVPLHEWVESEFAHPEVEAPPEEAPDITPEGAALVTLHPPTGPPSNLISWLYEPGSHTPLAKLEGNTTTSIFTDHLGTPKLALNEQGEVIWKAHHDSYGRLQQTNKGTRNAIPFRYPGQYEDQETGLHYNRHRYYDPEAGTYLSQDPLGLGGGLRLHSYVQDPNTWVDPLGLVGGCGVIGQVFRIRNQIRALGVPSQVRSSGAVHHLIDSGRTLVVSENHFRDIVRAFGTHNGRLNLFRKSFWQHVLPHRHVYRLQNAPSQLNANWRKTFQNLGASKSTIWPWQ